MVDWQGLQITWAWHNPNELNPNETQPKTLTAGEEERDKKAFPLILAVKVYNH